jgi:hypothetical protein
MVPSAHEAVLDQIRRLNGGLHPRKECGKGLVKRLRGFLSELGYV